MASAASVAENFVFAPISLALSRRLSKSEPVAPDTAATLLIAESKSAAVFTAAVPSPVTTPVTGSSFCPTEEILFPTVCSFSPVAPIFCSAVADWFACSSRLRSLCSVSTISLCRASYWSWEIVPFRSASSACCCAVFKVSNFSLVSETACASSLCFCAISSVFPGSSFRSFSTSFSWLCVFLISVLTPFRAVCNFVVSPPISTVIPLILFPAIRLTP